ncbi:MAG: zinc finger Ran-binding domain-containing protein [Planctomycetia bacterium]|nr:zinc finger Ran-binding domain-containing protein [Planctomycetia bacterium]
MPSPPPKDNEVVCLSCGWVNSPHKNYCVACGAPITAHAVNDAFDTIKTSGWTYRKVQEAPRSLIVVLGVWFLFLPLAICCGVLLLQFLGELLRGRWPANAMEQLIFFVLYPLVVGVGAYVSTTIIRRTTQGYLQERARRAKQDHAPDDDDDDDSDDGGSFDADDFDDNSEDS